MPELDVAHLAGAGLLGRSHGITRDAAAHVLEADLARQQGLAALGAAGEDQLTEHLVLDQRQEFVEALVFVMMAVNVYDQNIVEVALDRLLSGMGEQAAGIELFE